MDSELSNTPAQLPAIGLFCIPATFSKRISKDPETGCWLWTGALFAGTGYGSFTYQHKQWRSHRYSWTAHFGPIPRGLDVLHHCDTPRCVNPHHLWLGTDKDNHQDKTRKGRHPQRNKTHCPYGHPYSFENTYWDPQSHRHCRTCKGMYPAEPWMPIELGEYKKAKHAKMLAARRRSQ